MGNISDYENKLYEQLEKTKETIKFWQNRCIDAEQQLYSITILYNQAGIDIQHLKAKNKGECSKK